MSVSTAIKKAWIQARRLKFKEAFRMLNLYANEMKLKSASSIVLDAGTSSDELSDLTTMLDGNIYNLAEAAGVPGMRLTATFTNVTEIYGLLIRAYYSGSSTHYCEVQLYNYTTEAWDAFMTVESSNGHNTRYIRIPSDADYISSSEAKIRWEHPVSGNASHDAYIDYIGIET